MIHLINLLFPTSPTGHNTEWCSYVPLTFFHFIFISLSVQTTTIAFSCLLFHHHLSTHASIPLPPSLLVSFLLFLPPALPTPPYPSFSFLPYPQGIGRLILKEEMKARSGCHDNDQWGSRRSSRCSSKEGLNNLGFSSLSGCKCVVGHLLHVAYSSHKTSWWS